MRFFARRAAYEVLPPPYPLDFDHWTADTAQDYLQWYTAHVPERAAYVYRRALGKPLPDGPIDPESRLRRRFSRTIWCPCRRPS